MLNGSLSIVPEWAPSDRSLSMADFTGQVQPRGLRAPARRAGQHGSNPGAGQEAAAAAGHRGHNRRFMNEQDILRVAELTSLACGLNILVFT